MTASSRLRALLDHLEEGFLAVALAFMTIITFIQVVLRYVFGTGLIWSLEATTYTFAWMVLVGMSYGVRTQSHIAVEVLVERLAPPVRRVAALLGLALCLTYCGFMISASAQFVDGLLTLGHNARDIPAPRWLLTGIMPVAFVLLAARFVQASWPVLTGRAAPAERQST